MARLVEVHPDNPQPRIVGQIGQLLRSGGLIAYPTDSGYALGAQLGNQAAKDRMRDIRRLDDGHHYTLVCCDFSQLGQFVHVDNRVFRAVKAATPGPYTFILPATREVPKKLLHPKKKTVGVRIPDHAFVHALLEEMGEPVLTTTLLLPDVDEQPHEGWAIAEALEHSVDAVIDVGDVIREPTTVIDLTEDEPEIVRVGSGDPSRFE